LHIKFGFILIAAKLLGYLEDGLSLKLWGTLIFVPIYVYMLIWSAIRFKHRALDVMFTGYDYYLNKK